MSAQNISNPQSENISQSLINYFQGFDIIDHAKKTNVQMSELEYLRSNSDQFHLLVNFVIEKDNTPCIHLKMVQR